MQRPRGLAQALPEGLHHGEVVVGQALVPAFRADLAPPAAAEEEQEQGEALKLALNLALKLPRACLTPVFEGKYHIIHPK